MIKLNERDALQSATEKKNSASTMIIMAKMTNSIGKMNAFAVKYKNLAISKRNYSTTTKKCITLIDFANVSRTTRACEIKYLCIILLN